MMIHQTARLVARAGMTGVAACRGSATRAASSLTVDNPYTPGERYCKVKLADSAGAATMVDKAAAAQKVWAEVPLLDRVDAMRRALNWFDENADQVAADITGQMGKPLAQAKGEIGGMRERAEGMIHLAPFALAQDVLPEKPGFYRRIVHEPVGVVLTVAPWNYPLLTAMNTIAPAILAGNSVVLKHSSRTPLCANAFQAAFEAAGCPEGLLTALHCSHSVIDDVIGDQRVQFVAFTGSVEGGHSIYQSIARSRFIDCTLELGGKDPAYVAEDANMEAAVGTLVDGAFYNAGQSCCGIERIYVHKSRYDEFMEGALKAVQQYKLGDPMAEGTTMGPLAQANASKFLAGQIEDAVAKGAQVLTGGKATKDANGKGRFFEPTLVGNCNHTMNLMMEESFGPVVGVQAVEDDDAAVELMNDSPYGLTACVFTEDADRAALLAPRISTGTVFMNRCDYLDPELPWTGVRDTGKGVSLSKHGFRGVTKLKGHHFKLPAKEE